jgi:hypothetical protein
MARAIFNYEQNKYSIATWLKVEIYNFLMTVLPKLIAFAVWIAIIAAIYWGVTLDLASPNYPSSNLSARHFDGLFYAREKI